MKSCVYDMSENNEKYRFWLEDTKENGIILKIENCATRQIDTITDGAFAELIFGWTYKQISVASKTREARAIATRLVKANKLPNCAIDCMTNYAVFLDQTREITPAKSKIWGTRSRCEMDLIANEVIGNNSVKKQAIRL